MLDGLSLMPLYRRLPEFRKGSAGCAESSNRHGASAADRHCQGKAHHLQLDDDEKVHVPALSAGGPDQTRSLDISAGHGDVLLTIGSSLSHASSKRRRP